MLKRMKVWSVQVIGDDLSTVMLLGEVKIGSRRCPVAWEFLVTCWGLQSFLGVPSKLGWCDFLGELSRFRGG